MRRMSETAPYASLTPDRILDALDSVGIAGDGRLLGLNSYENRVYLAYCEDAPPVVVKFYRPARWSDAQILEEHAFVAELAEREIPAVAPLSLRAARCIASAACASPCIRSMAAARPNSKTARRSNGWAASSAASTRSASSRVCASPGARHREFGDEPRDVPARRTISFRRICSTLIGAFRRWRSTACATASSARAT